ncbi:MAG: hypothetical protein HYW50_02505 [Candidatus Diapherotrites archaeon]|nr:hypothetical protein [Candidatus Diapherotrites archaeon]
MQKGKKKTRFEMVKERHKNTFYRALKENLVDGQVVSLCEFFAKSKNFFTSSTCSGRIVLLQVNRQENKHESAFIAKWHKKASIGKVWSTLCAKTMEEIWLKQEPFIMHIGCADFENAKTILQIAKACGIKRAGIQVAKEGKFLLEIIGTHNISFPVKKGGEILVEKKHLKYVLKRANEKLEKNYSTLEKFENACRKNLE